MKGQGIRKLFVLLAATLAVGLLLAGCGGGCNGIE